MAAPQIGPARAVQGLHGLRTGRRDGKAST